MFTLHYAGRQYDAEASVDGLRGLLTALRAHELGMCELRYVLWAVGEAVGDALGGMDGETVYSHSDGKGGSLRVTVAWWMGRPILAETWEWVNTH